MFIYRYIPCVPDIDSGLDDTLDCHQQRLDPSSVLFPRQRESGLNNSHEHCSLLPTLTIRSPTQEGLT